MRRILMAIVVAALVLTPLAGADTASAQVGVNPTAIAPAENLWTGYYYDNANWSGAPVQTGTYQHVNFDWRYGSPGPSVPVDFFTARWDLDTYFYAGTYEFTGVADDEFVLVVDNITYVDTRDKKLHGKTQMATITFPYAGVRRVTVFFREWKETAYIRVDWKVNKGGSSGGAGGGTGGGSGGGNSNQCMPASVDKLSTQYGNYTPCIQNNWHQSSCFASNGAWDAPNLGSISSEPKIEIWGKCSPDQNTYFTVSCDPNVPQKNYRCSKTRAGWYPY